MSSSTLKCFKCLKPRVPGFEWCVLYPLGQWLLNRCIHSLSAALLRSVPSALVSPSSFGTSWRISMNHFLCAKWPDNLMASSSLDMSLPILSKSEKALVMWCWNLVKGSTASPIYCFLVVLSLHPIRYIQPDRMWHLQSAAGVHWW